MPRGGEEAGSKRSVVSEAQDYKGMANQAGRLSVPVAS